MTALFDEYLNEKALEKKSKRRSASFWKNIVAITTCMYRLDLEKLQSTISVAIAGFSSASRRSARTRAEGFLAQDKAAWWLANRDYKRSTGHDLEADLKSGKFDPRELQNTWVSIRNLGANKWAHRFYDGATTTLASAGTGSGSGDSPSTAGTTSFNMPEGKAKGDLTAAKGPDLSSGLQQDQPLRRRQRGPVTRVGSRRGRAG
jgi:hypothetical protein